VISVIPDGALLAQLSYVGLTRVSINLRKSIFEADGIAGRFPRSGLLLKLVATS
jgi:hypothetical protein